MSRTIVIVTSKLGLGHVTRQIALKNEIIKNYEDIRIRFVCSEIQKNFFEKAIKTDNRVKIEAIPQVPEVTMDDWLKVNIDSTIDSYQRSWDFETQIRDDVEWGRILFNSDLVINDIESIHNPICKKMNLPILNISNFTWSDILFHFNKSIELTKNYEKLEQMADFHYKLPMSSLCRGMVNPEKMGLLCREINKEMVNKIKSKTEKPTIFFNLSNPYGEINSFDLAKKLIRRGYTLITRQNLMPENSNVITFTPAEPNVQNYVAASDIVVSKVGYGICSEALSAGKPLIHWKRYNMVEDDKLSLEFTKTGKGELINKHVKMNEILDSIDKYTHVEYKPTKIETYNIVKNIVNIID